MAGYFAEEIITPIAGETSFLCFAIDRSSNPDHTPYYQKLVDSLSLAETPLGSLALLDTLTPAVVAAVPPTVYQHYQPIRTQFSGRIPTFTLGCSHAAIMGLLFPVDYPYNLFRLVDVLQKRIIFEFPLPHVYRVQFNSLGTRCMFFGSQGYRAFQIDHGLVPLFTLDDDIDRNLAYQPMWYAERWCLFQRLNRMWCQGRSRIGLLRHSGDPPSAYEKPEPQ